MKNLPLKLLVGLLVVSTAGLVACGEDEADADNLFTDVDLVEIIDRSDDESVGQYHDDHWHGYIELEADADEHGSFGFRFLDHDDEEIDIPLGDDGYDYALEIEGEEHVSYDTHSDHFHLTGEEEGQAQLFIDFTYDDDVVFDTRGQAFDIFVDDDHDHNGHDHDELHVEEFVLLDRAHDPHAPIADLHDDHWHGDFSDGFELTAVDDPDDYGDDRGAVEDTPGAVSLGALVEEEHDDHTHSVELDGNPYELDVHSHSDEIATHSHGDHVHIVGVEAGHAHVTFQIVDRADDEVVFETPEFEIDVVDE